MRSYYSRFLKFLLDQFTIEWMEKLPKHCKQHLIDDFFLTGYHHDAFMTLCSTVADTSPSYRLNKCVLLLEEFIRRHNIAHILFELCDAHNSAAQLTSQRDTVVLLITTLPDRVTNKLQRETSEIFLPQNYIPLVAGDMLVTLDKVHAQMQSSKDVAIGVLGSLLGKMCNMGHGELLFSGLLPGFLARLQTDYVWCRLSEGLVSSVPSSCMESVVTLLLQQVPWYGSIDKLLGNSVVTNKKLQYLLTNKLLVLRHFNQVNILQNIIGYLRSSPTRIPLFKQVMLMLLDVWSDSGAIKHTSYQQHLYISKALLICVAFMQDKDIQDIRNELLEKLMAGVQNHLESSVAQLRRLGMVVSEALTAAIHPTGEKLQFEYEEDSETQSLKKLLIVPERVEPFDEKMNRNFDDDMKKLNLNSDEKLPTMENSTENLDSDDDFAPYDMSHDVKVTKTKKPVYIRTCMEGLITSDDPDRVEACLTASESLIRSKPDGLREIAAEFAKILLHLPDNYAIPQFSLMKHGALVALTVHCPVEVAECLTKEFYDRNYNIRQRLDMLEVLAAAAQELSQPAHEAHMPTPPVQPIVQQLMSEDDQPEAKHWRNIVEERIKQKTRRFGKGRTRPEATPVANRFALVAGNFFFPLIQNFDQKHNTFDLLGEDHLLLARLLYTLGIIIHAAVNTTIIRQMSKILLEFIWALRYHPQKGVCRAVLFAVCMTLLSVPGHMILTDLQAEICEIRLWLQDTVDQSRDEESQKMALQALLIMQELINKEYQT